MIDYVGWDVSQKVTAICVVDETAAGCGVASTPRIRNTSNVRCRETERRLTSASTPDP
jgi:hypothetical protein